MSGDGIAAVRKIAMNITLPAVALTAFARAEYSLQSLWAALWIFLVCCGMLGLGFFLRKALGVREKTAPYLCTGFEGGMLGYALYPMLFGSLSPFAIVSLGNVLFIFTVYRAMLCGARGVGAVLQEAARSPSLLAILLGILLGATGAYRALEPSGGKELLDGVLSFLSAPTSFLILLTVGYDLRLTSVSWAKVLCIAFCRLLICGLMLGFTLLAGRFLMKETMQVGAVLMLFLLPPPFVVSAFNSAPEEQAFISSFISVMTLFTLCLFSLMALWF